MSAVQFFLPYQTATYNGIAQPGAKLKFYTTGTTTPLVIYSNSGLSVAASNPVVANGAGQFPTVYLDSTKTYRLVITDKNDVSLGVDIDPYIPGTIPDASVLTPYTASATASAASATSSASAASTSASAASTSASAASTSATSAASSASTASAAATAASTSISAVPNATAHAATRTALSALGSSSGPAYLHESGREGTFVFSSANLSASVTADATQGVYVAPASDTTGASGAWVRTQSGSTLNLKHFGAKGDKTTDDSTALSAAIAVANLTTQTGVGYGTPVRDIYAPYGWYRFYSTGFSPANPIRFKGDGNGIAGGPRTVFEWADNVDGITFSTAFLEGSSVEGILFKGGYSTGAEAASGHAINSLAKISVTNCAFFNWSLDGVHFNANGGTGNCNGAIVTSCFFQNCRNGIYCFSGDANAITGIGNDFEANRQAGVYDASFLGNTWVGNEAASNGCTSKNDGVNVPITVCSYSGNGYFVIFGQETWASANAPSGTTADNTGWAYWTTAAPSATFGRPAWVAGLTTRAGGSYICTNSNARSQFTGNYHETDQPPAQMAQCAVAQGGMLANNIWRGNNGSTNTGTAVAANGKLSCNRPLASGAYDGAMPGISGFAPQIGEWGVKTMLKWPDGATNDWRIQSDGVDQFWRYANVAADTAFTVTGSATTFQFGTGVIQPFCFFSNNLRVGNGNNARLINTANAAPASGTLAKGSIFLNYTYAGPTTVMAWMSNSTGGFTTDVLVSGLNAYGVGYVTGAGGTVTQGTSKSTGVTLNKLSGQITTNAAALASATKVSFVITNSQVAATDVVLVNVASGGTANAYRADTTAVAAGSFTVTVENITAGSLSEAPVLNFAVIKATNS